MKQAIYTKNLCEHAPAGIRLINLSSGKKQTGICSRGGKEADGRDKLRRKGRRDGRTRQ